MTRRLGPILDGASAIAMIAASAVVIWWVLKGPGTALPPAQNVRAPVESVGFTETFDERVGAAQLGRSDAEWAVVEFSDFECPFCGRYARESLPELRRDFVDSGKLRYILVNFPLEQIHPRALPAAKAAACANMRGKYWDMHDRLFMDPPKLEPADLAGHASALGLDVAGFNDCLEHVSESAIRAGQQLGARLGVNSTPTFFLGRIGADGQVQLTRKWRGAMSWADTKPLLEQELRH
jgi:protein-disulfide isomerase